MIEKLKNKDLKKAAKVYNKGLKMEIPPGSSTIQETIDHLKKELTFVYKENNKIEGLVTFNLKNKEIRMRFICAMKLRKGIGKKLMKKLVDFSTKNKVKMIYSNVSLKDKRVLEFYNFLGFKKYQSYYSNRNFKLYRIKAKPKEIKI